MSNPSDPEAGGGDRRWVVNVLNMLDPQLGLAELYVHVIAANVLVIPPSAAFMVPPDAGELLCAVLREARDVADQMRLG